MVTEMFHSMGTLLILKPVAQTGRDAESPEAAQLEVRCGYRQTSSIPDKVGRVSKKKL